MVTSEFSKRLVAAKVFPVRGITQDTRQIIAYMNCWIVTDFVSAGPIVVESTSTAGTLISEVMTVTWKTIGV